MKKYSLLSVFQWAISLAVSLPIILFTVILLFSEQQNITESNRLQSEIMLNSIDSFLERFLENQKVELEKLLYYFENGEREIVSKNFTEFYGKNSAVIKVEFVDYEGDIHYLLPYQKDFIGINRSGFALFDEVKRTRESTWDKTEVSVQMKKSVIRLFLPGSDTIAIASLDLSQLIEPFRNFIQSDEFIFFLSDADGIYLVHSDEERVANREYNLDQDRWLSNYQGEILRVYQEKDDEKHLYSVEFLQPLNWCIGLYHDNSRFRKRQSSQLIIILVSLGLLLIVLLFLVNTFGNQVFEVLTNIIRYSRYQGADTVSLEKKISKTNFIELDELRKNFNHLLSSIGEREKEIINLNSDLERKVEERTRKLKNSMNELENTRDQLIESEKMSAMGTLVAGVAHEVNTPLGVAFTGSSFAFNQLEYLEKSIASMDTEKSKKHLDSLKESLILVTNNLKRSSNLVKNFKQISIDHVHQQIREINVRTYIEESLASLFPKVFLNRFSISIEGDDPLIETYPALFTQVLTNLINNTALHAYAPKESGEIKIIIKNEESSVKIIYEDHGAGIDKKVIKKIFDPFYTTKRNLGGTGLGLSITYNLLHTALDGTIHCESAKGEYTRFILTLPIRLKKNTDILDETLESN